MDDIYIYNSVTLLDTLPKSNELISEMIWAVENDDSFEIYGHFVV